VPGQIPAGEIHHLRLTVTDAQRSREFYTSLLGFQVAVESPPPDDPGADEAFSIDVLPFDDPDGIQLELTTPVVPSADGS
jgi:glyoxylase I family protein